MRSMTLSVASSTAFFAGVTTVLVGSALKLAHMGLGGIPLWNAANAFQSIGLIIVSGIFLWSVKTLAEEAETEPVPRYVPPRKPTMRFAELPRNNPEPDSVRHGHDSPLGTALGKLARRPQEVAHMNRRPSEQNDETGQDGTPGEELALQSDRAAHDRGALQTANEHCFAGSDGKKPNSPADDYIDHAKEEREMWEKTGAK